MLFNLVWGLILRKTKGTIYEGEWRNNLPNGKGVEMTRSGVVIYDGEWKDGLYDGRGVWTPLHEQTRYEGELVAGQQHGWGKETSDYSTYEVKYYSLQVTRPTYLTYSHYIQI